MEIHIKDYTEECIVTFGEIMDKDVNTPVKHYLFSVEEVQTTSEEMMDIFHHIVANVCTQESKGGY